METGQQKFPYLKISFKQHKNYGAPKERWANKQTKKVFFLCAQDSFRRAPVRTWFVPLGNALHTIYFILSKQGRQFAFKIARDKKHKLKIGLRNVEDSYYCGSHNFSYCMYRS